jgi:hypothetical protein
MKNTKKQTIGELVGDFSKKLTAEGFELMLMPSKLPDSQFIYASKDGAKPILALASVLEADKYAKAVAKEIEDHRKSVRLYVDNPAGSSVEGKPLSVLMQNLQSLSESWVNKKGDSSNFVGVVTDKGFRTIRPTKKDAGENPFERVSKVGRKHNAQLVVLGWGGWERSVKPPFERTGRETVATTVFCPDGSVFATLSRAYTRKDKTVVWGNKENILWRGGELEASSRHDTAWKKAA